jgi:hypothetical protein
MSHTTRRLPASDAHHGLNGLSGQYPRRTPARHGYAACRHAPLQARAPRRRGAGLASILLHHEHPLLRPAAGAGAVDQSIWEPGRLLVPPHRLDRRVADIHHGEAVPVMPLHLGPRHGVARCGMAHRRSPPGLWWPAAAARPSGSGAQAADAAGPPGHAAKGLRQLVGSCCVRVANQCTRAKRASRPMSGGVTG